MPSPSHQLFYRPIVLKLLSQGHHVTYVTLNPINNPSLLNLTEIDISHMYQRPFLKTKIQNLIVNEREQSDLLLQFNEEGIKYHERLIPSLNDLIHNREEHKFDLVVFEWTKLFYSIFGELYNCPMVAITSTMHSCEIDYLTRNAMPLSGGTVADVPYTHRMSFWERLENWWFISFFIRKYHARNVELDKQLYQKFVGEPVPDLSRIYGRVNIFLVNSHPIYVQPKPNLPGIVQIGGMHNVATKPLPNVSSNFNTIFKVSLVFFRSIYKNT